MQIFTSSLKKCSADKTEKDIRKNVKLEYQ